MTVTDLVNGNNLVKEKTDYVLNSFEKEFPGVYLKNGKRHVKICESNGYYLCYFFVDRENNVRARFKSHRHSVSIFSDTQTIDFYIKNTINYFSNNNYAKRKTGLNSIANYLKLLDITIKEDDFNALIEKSVIKNGETIIGQIVSVKTANALYKEKIIKIADLKGWNYERLKKVEDFTSDVLTEIYYVLYSLMSSEMPKDLINKEINFLNTKAPLWQIKNFIKKDYIISYLQSINFDETQFNFDTIGRILCLNIKARKEEISVSFTKNANSLKEEYQKNQGQFSSLLTATKTLLYKIVEETSLTPIKKNATLLMLDIEGNKPTYEMVADRYGYTRQWASLIFNKALKNMGYTISLYDEKGISLYLLKKEYIKLFSSIPLDAFMLYLKVEKQDFILKALTEVVLKGFEIPKDLKEKFNTALELIKEEQKVLNKEKEIKLLKEQSLTIEDEKEINKDKPKEKKPYKKSEFEYIVDDDGVVITDLVLLEKLRKARLDLSYRFNYPPYMVYSNKQLVVLATFKPTTKTEYASLRYLTEKTWDNKGCVMAKIIKEHIDETGK